jgi:hypothetical protein
MLRTRGWTESEVDTLRTVYPSSIDFQDLIGKFPGRTPNSIRLMASRLGLHRQGILPEISSMGSVSGVDGDARRLVRCGQCGRGFFVDASSGVVTCDHCGGLSYLGA